MAKGTNKRRGRHDATFKNLYGFGLMAWDLMEIILPQALFDELDPGTLERLPAEWFSPVLDRRVGDCVWRAQRRGGGSLVMPVEFQRRSERLMPVRTHTYTGLMLEDLARRDELDPGGRLPLVWPVVLYNGVRPWRGPTNTAELSAGGADLPAPMAFTAFALVDMGRMRVEDLPRNNAVTAQVEVHQGALARNPDEILGRLSERLGGPERRALRMAFVEWVRQSVAPGMEPKVPKLKDKLTQIAELGELQDMKSLVLKSMVDYWMAEGMAKGKARGVSEGMARGVTEGLARARADERALLCRQADRKFGNRTGERLSALIDGVSEPERLAEVGDWIIDCGTEAEFLARAQRPG